MQMWAGGTAFPERVGSVQLWPTSNTAATRGAAVQVSIAQRMGLLAVSAGFETGGPRPKNQHHSIILTAELVIRRPESKGSNCNKTRQEFELLEIIFSRNCDHCTKYLSHEQRCLTGIAPLHFKIFLGTLITFEACPSVFVCLCIFNYGVNTGPEHEFCNCFLQTQY